MDADSLWSGYAWDVVLDSSENKLFVANGEFGLSVWDITTHSVLSETEDWYYKAAKKLILNPHVEMLYIATEESMVFMNVTNLSAPTTVSDGLSIWID